MTNRNINMRVHAEDSALRAVLVLLGVLVLCLSAFAAPREGAEAQARSMDEGRQAVAVGAYDDAIDIFEEILEENPDHELAFWGLVRAYSLADRGKEVVSLLEDRLLERPDDLQARMELGEAHARLGNRELAHAAWTKALEYGPSDAGRYAEIGAREIHYRMFEQALDTFTRGREAFRSDTLFSQELAQVYTLVGDYDSALDECAGSVRGRRGAVAWATNRVEFMLESGASRGEVTDYLDRLAESDGVAPEVLNFAGSSYLVLDRPDRALSAFVRADELSGGTGNELLEYGEILKDHGLPDKAREAFMLVKTRHEGSGSAAKAGIAAALILEERGEPLPAVNELKAVADEFDRASVGAQALFEAARIELHRLNDPESTLETVRELESRFGERARMLEQEALLLEIRAHMALSHLEQAYDLTNSLLRRDLRAEVREGAMFSLGYISFLMGDNRRAISEFRTMVQAHPSGSLVNDALRLMLVIAEAEESQSPEPLRLLAEAHVASLAGDDRSALASLEALAGGYPATGAAVEALMMTGKMEEREGDTARALETYAELAAEPHAITPRAEAMMRRGDILASSGRAQEAVAEYKRILEELPPNALAGEARRKIEKLGRPGGEE